MLADIHGLLCPFRVPSTVFAVWLCAFVNCIHDCSRSSLGIFSSKFFLIVLIYCFHISGHANLLVSYLALRFLWLILFVLSNLIFIVATTNSWLLLMFLIFRGQSIVIHWHQVCSNYISAFSQLVLQLFQLRSMYVHSSSQSSSHSLRLTCFGWTRYANAFVPFSSKYLLPHGFH